jgi:hypothetical protein
MAEEAQYTEQEFHRKMGVDLFNMVWDLMDKEERTLAEDFTMVHAAHASRYHWGEIGTALNFERGEWQISRVYAVQSMPESALFHAEKCLEICEENSIADFDIAFAYEAVALATAVAGNAADCQKYLDLAKQAGKDIKKEGDKQYFFDELGTISCGEQ